MEFVKKNLVFCLIVGLCILAAAAGGYLAFVESGKVGSAKSQIVSAESQLNALLNANPAPSVENLAASEQNVADLTAQLRSIRENLQRGSRIKTSSDGVGVMAGIQQYISDYQGRIQGMVDDDGEQKILVPADFGFGFEKYLEDAELISDPKVNAALDKQRQILSFIVNKVIESGAVEINAVERELVELPADSKSNNGFQINDAISKRVPGALDTMAFSVTFTGYTNALRMLLNELAKFELPIVVSSIEVERPRDSATTAAPTNNLDALFGFGGESDATEEVVSEQVPVVSDNESSFTIVLEFIDVILPSNEK